jgi:hypothetical protein
VIRAHHIGYSKVEKNLLSNPAVAIECASEFPCQATFPSGELREVNFIADGGDSVGFPSLDEGCDVSDGF